MYTNNFTRENLKTQDLRDNSRTPRTYIDRLDTDQKDISGFNFGNTSEIQYNQNNEKSFTQLRNKTIQSSGKGKNDRDMLSKVFETNKGVNSGNNMNQTNSGFYTNTQQLNSTFERNDQATDDYNRKKSTYSNLILYIIFFLF